MDTEYTSGNRVHKPAKVDNWSSNGIFVGYTATTKNIYYIDDETNIVKIGVHAIFDEAHCTVPQTQPPIAVQALQTLGYPAFQNRFKNRTFQSKHKLKIRLVHNNATTPIRTSDKAIGFYIHICLTTTILPGESKAVPTGLKINITPTHYLEIIPMPAMPVNNFTLDSHIIAPNNNSDVHIIVKNTTDRTVYIKKRRMYCSDDLPQSNHTHHQFKTRMQFTFPRQSVNTPYHSIALTSDSQATEKNPPTPPVYHITGDNYEIDKEES